MIPQSIIDAIRELAADAEVKDGEQHMHLSAAKLGLMVQLGMNIVVYGDEVIAALEAANAREKAAASE